MGRVGITITVAAAMLIYGQAQFISGFNNGADTNLCVMGAVLHPNDALNDACRRISVRGIRMRILRLYRKAMGDEVPSRDRERK